MAEVEQQAGCGGQGERGPIDGETLAVDRFVLANGLEVWHKPRPGTGTVSLVMIVRVGTRYETQHNNGISHYLEHMLFDGTARWNEFETREVIRRRGGYFNAQTDYEYTAYEVHLPAKDFELALDWLAEILFRPTLAPDKVARERQVLMQEKGGRSSRVLELLESWGLGYDLGWAVRRKLYPGSSLALRVSGEDASLDRIDRDELVAFHERYYRPNNMALVVVGDVDPGRVSSGVERELAGLVAQPVPPAGPLPPAPARGINVRLMGPHFADRSAMRSGARTVSAGHPDTGALEVLAEILSNRLTDQVRLQQGLVYSIGAYNVSLSDTGYFVIRTESDAGKMDGIMAAVEQHLERLRSEPIPEEELAEAKALLAGQFALSTQSNASLAWVYAADAIWCRPGMPLPDYCRRIEGVTAEEVMRVARRYFVPDNSYLGLYRPALTLKTGALSLAAGLALMVGMVLWQRGQGDAVGV